jgi:hypothetical protein
MTVAAGPGGHTFYEQGSLYLTGPYRGAPFGLSIVVPTVAGPFDLGNVVVRARIDVDPHSTALTVTSDPLPQIIDGIPLRLRTANVTVDRPGFIFNPTDCAQQRIAATISGAQGARARLRAVRRVRVRRAAPGPTLRVFTRLVSRSAGRASRAAHVPHRRAVRGEGQVELPSGSLTRLTTLKACPAATFGSHRRVPGGVGDRNRRATTPLAAGHADWDRRTSSHGGEAFPR